MPNTSSNNTKKGNAGNQDNTPETNPWPSAVLLSDATLDTEDKETGTSAPAPISNAQAKKSDFEKRIVKLIEKGRKRGRRFSIIGITYSILICVLVLGTGYFLVKEISNIADKVNKQVDTIPASSNFAKQEIIIPIRWQTCLSDSDCVETQKDCCRCSTGGEQSAINNQYFKSWQDHINKRCTGKSCLAQSKCQTGKAVCKNKICKFIASLVSCGNKGDKVLATASSSPSDLEKLCCPGLKLIAAESNEVYYCTNCGNQICELPENNTNCPPDCMATSSYGQIIK